MNNIIEVSAAVQPFFPLIISLVGVLVLAGSLFMHYSRIERKSSTQQLIAGMAWISFPLLLLMAIVWVLFFMPI